MPYTGASGNARAISAVTRSAVLGYQRTSTALGEGSRVGIDAGGVPERDHFAPSWDAHAQFAEKCALDGHLVTNQTRRA
jgi:hypothetical protein